jgi:HPt (histidine-containing phosphotransfer) domain-containing protein
MNEPVIDAPTFKDLQEAAGADFVVELVATFFEEAPGMLAELRAALAEQAAGSADAVGDVGAAGAGGGASERFRRAAHSLKTNALTFGALRLGAAARGLELAGLTAVAAQAAGGDPLAPLEAAYAEGAAALRELTVG